ncbi:alpha/beta fold hydrolase [Psychromarinibacter sp. C21-152]|uniref:Alpha/beta fold hydrolase n=1 Tax=Psychromarinibacter sediminicola TaxID=3033385 RepID=A0AAE3NTI3_9RHOB|nr:alpha/beta fold hydrolase [Psychromarinibacter sediminicola]MDF0601379.1 alpha/beta fold hydrolase [Psychromarinibacter sediminicola]
MTRQEMIALPGGPRLTVRIDGPEDAPWVVLSNSVMTDFTLWDGQIPALADRYRVLRYDQRGHGGSDVPDGPMRFDDYGADVIALLDALDVSRCTFVGLSMGTPTGLAAYAAAPDRFAGFVAVDGVARSAPGREAFWTERRELARSHGMAALADGTAARWMPGASENDPAVAALVEMIARTPSEGFAAATHALQSYDYTDVVPRLDVPVLSIAGAQDGALPDTIRSQFGAVPGAGFATIPGAGHLPNYQCPDAFNTALTAFLDAHTPQTTKETD